mmetsp:Transcript_15082/g.46757  ORF Transcript_15082/g.46757 Transcript_15082/m.46757 type:complete len:255 (-) Transcript_15082:271-1035(-)
MLRHEVQEPNQRRRRCLVSGESEGARVIQDLVRLERRVLGHEVDELLVLLGSRRRAGRRNHLVHDAGDGVAARLAGAVARGRQAVVDRTAKNHQGGLRVEGEREDGPQARELRRAERGLGDHPKRHVLQVGVHVHFAAAPTRVCDQRLQLLHRRREVLPHRRGGDVLDAQRAERGGDGAELLRVEIFVVDRDESVRTEQRMQHAHERRLRQRVRPFAQENVLNVLRVSEDHAGALPKADHAVRLGVVQCPPGRF